MDSTHALHHHNNGEAGKKLRISIALNFATALLQIIVGLFSGSLALISDAIHNFSDVASLLISYIAQNLATRGATPSQTFGFRRAEILAAFINASALIGVAVVICFVAISRFWQPVAIKSTWVFAFAGLGVLVNGLGARLLKPHTHHNLNLKSAYFHLLADMTTSIAVMLNAVLIYIFEWALLDSLLSLGIALFLVYTAWDLLMQALRVLMQFSPREISLGEVERCIRQHSAIENAHHLHCWQLTDQQIHLEAHLDFKEDLPLSEVSKISEEIKTTLEKMGITHIILQAEIGAEHSKELLSCGIVA